MEVYGKNDEESVPPCTEVTGEDSPLAELSEDLTQVRGMKKKRDVHSQKETRKEHGSEWPLMSAETDKKETSEKPKKGKKSKFMKKIGLLKSRIQKIEKDILETEEKVGTVMNKFQLTNIPTGSEYQVKDTAPQQYSADVAPTNGKEPEENGDVVKVKMQRDHQPLKTSSSSSFSTSSSNSEGPRLVSLLKGLKLQQKTKLSPVIEEDKKFNISSVKLPPPSSLKVPPLKKEKSPKETPITKKFSIKFEEEEEIEKDEDKNFNSFSSEKNLTDTTDFPWEPIVQDRIKPQEENVINIDLDPFAIEENWFDKKWSECAPIDGSSVWGDASTMDHQSFDNVFSDIFNEPLKQSHSHEMTEIISDQSLPVIVENATINEKENKPKKKKPFKWIRNLFNKRSKKTQKD